VENLASSIRLVLLTVDAQTYALHLEAVDRNQRAGAWSFSRLLQQGLTRRRDHARFAAQEYRLGGA